MKLGIWDAWVNDRTYPNDRSGSFEVVAEVRLLNVPEVLLGEATSGMVQKGPNSQIYNYEGKKYTERQCHRLVEKLRKKVLARAVADAEANLARLKSTKI